MSYLIVADFSGKPLDYDWAYIADHGGSTKLVRDARVCSLEDAHALVSSAVFPARFPQIKPLRDCADLTSPQPTTAAAIAHHTTAQETLDYMEELSVGLGSECWFRILCDILSILWKPEEGFTFETRIALRQLKHYPVSVVVKGLKDQLVEEHGK